MFSFIIIRIVSMKFIHRNFVTSIQKSLTRIRHNKYCNGLGLLVIFQYVVEYLLSLLLLFLYFISTLKLR